MRIANNIAALTTSKTLKRADNQVVGAMQRLSSGSRINSAKDDAAGLAIANKLSIQVTGLNRASQNSMDGISLIQTADGSLNEVTNMLQRMRELAVQAASGVLSPADKSKIQLEINQLIDEINQNAFKTEFNKIKLLSGEADTLTENLTAAGAYGENIASVLNLSSSVPPGYLQYTIDRPGLPAEVSIDPNELQTGADVTFTLNEVSVSINAADDLNTIRAKLMEAANLASLELKFGPDGLAYLATKTAGSTQRITVNSAGLSSINRQSTGTNAVIAANAVTHAPDVSFYNPDGTLHAGFSTGLGIRSEGNVITLSGTNNQSIRLGLKVFFNPAGTGLPAGGEGLPAGVGPRVTDFVYGDGKSTDTASQTGGTMIAAPYAGGTPITPALEMITYVKDYGPLYLQIGPNYNQHMPVGIPRLDAETLGLAEYTGGALKVTLDYQSVAGASRAIGALDNALEDVVQVRAWIGAYQNRLEQTVLNLDSSGVNVEAARSRIQDTDMASAMSEYMQYNVIYQAGLAILAQANQRPQQILSLLQ